MAYSNEMMIEDAVIAIIRKAIANPANADWKNNPWEGINWNFVESDLYIDLCTYDDTYLNDCIEKLVDDFYGELV